MAVVGFPHFLVHAASLKLACPCRR